MSLMTTVLGCSREGAGIGAGCLGTEIVSSVNDLVPMVTGFKVEFRELPAAAFPVDARDSELDASANQVDLSSLGPDIEWAGLPPI